jgi:hypothetical protein
MTEQHEPQAPEAPQEPTPDYSTIDAAGVARMLSALKKERASRKEAEKANRKMQAEAASTARKAIESATAEVADGARRYVAELEKAYQERLAEAEKKAAALAYRSEVGRAARAAGLKDDPAATDALLAHLEALGVRYCTDPLGVETAPGLFKGDAPAMPLAKVLTSTPALAAHVRDLAAQTGRAPSTAPKRPVPLAPGNDEASRAALFASTFGAHR